MFDAYNIRKIAPRMLLAVIGVNLSIYLCVAAVDITNVIGGGLGALIRGPFLDPNTFGNIDLDTGSGAGGKIATGAIVGLVGAGAATGFLATMFASAVSIASGSFAFILIVLLLLIVGAILMALAIMATIVIRYGAIILLTLVSPVAISMLVLPGTEKYFRKWWEYFTKTLMVYPIIAAIFAVSDVMGAIFLKAQRATGGPIEDLIVIFVIIAVVYAPLFMIPFSFKLAGGFLGSIYDFANKNLYGRAKPRMDKWKERPDSLYGQKKTQAYEVRKDRGFTWSQIGKGVSAGYRGVRSPGEDEKGNRLSRREAFRQRYKSASLYQGGSMSRAAAIEAEEKDQRVKDMLGNDDLGYAMFKYAEALSKGKSKTQAEQIAREALAYKDEYMFDTSANAKDKDGKAITDEERRRRIQQQSSALDQINTIHGTYGDKTSMMIGARQDSRASTGEDGVSMREMVLAATDNGEDQLGMTAFLGDLRTLSKEAKRVDKSGIGFSSDIGVMEQLKAGKIGAGQAREDLLLGALEKSSASEIATMHDKGMREMQEILKKRIEDARTNATARLAADGKPIRPESLMEDAEYQTAMAQAANLYDAFQYATPKNMEELAPFMSDASITASGNSVLQDIISMRGKDETFSTFAANRRDYGASEAEAGISRGGGQPKPGGF